MYNGRTRPLQPSLDLSRMWDDSYIQTAYERLYAPAYHSENQREGLDSTPSESNLLTRNTVRAEQVRAVGVETVHINCSDGSDISDELISTMLLEGPPHFEGNTSFLRRQLLIVQHAHEALLEEYRLNSPTSSVSRVNVDAVNTEKSGVGMISIDAAPRAGSEAGPKEDDARAGGALSSASLLQDPSLDEGEHFSDGENEEGKEASKTDGVPRDEEDKILMMHYENSVASLAESVDAANGGADTNLLVGSSEALPYGPLPHGQGFSSGADVAADAVDHLPTNAQIGIRLFFRLLRTLRFNENPRVLSKVVQQIPLLLSKMPPLALAEGLRNPSNDQTLKRLGEGAGSGGDINMEGPGKTATKSNLGVVDALSWALESAVIASKTNEVLKKDGDSSDRRLLALSAIVGLAIKRGSLTHILKSIILTLDYTTDLSHAKSMVHRSLPVRQYLEELSHAKHTKVEVPLEFGNAKGTLMTFGKGDHGKLGLGQCTHAQCADGQCTENKTSPVFIDALQNVRITLIDSLSTHSVAVTEDGSLYTWGNGDKHRLGHGTTSKEYAPRLVQSLRNKPAVIDVACGLGHTLVLLATGQVYSWGNGGNGRLGHGDTQDRATACLVNVLEGMNVAAVFSGASHSLAISDEGACISWGKNNQGQCGHGNMTDHLFPMVIEYFEGKGDLILQVAGGWEHTLATTRDGRIFSFGSGYKDSRRAGLPPVLGHGGNEHQLVPCQIMALSDENVVHIACGWDHSLAVTAEGILYTWGAGTNGKLGHGDEADRAIPTIVDCLRGRIIIQAEAGCEHSAAVTFDGELLTWGHGDSGRLGHGETKSENKPRLVAFDGGLKELKVVSIAVGDKYNMILVKGIEEAESREDAVKEVGVVEKQDVSYGKGDAWMSHVPSKVAVDNGRDSEATQRMSFDWILEHKMFTFLKSTDTVGQDMMDSAGVYSPVPFLRLPVVVLAHLERLVQPFLESSDSSSSDSSVSGFITASVLAAANAQNGEDELSDSEFIPKFAYCIEPSENALVLFHSILSRAYQDNYSSDGITDEWKLCRWCISWCVLRLLKANLRQLLTAVNVDIPGNKVAGNVAPCGNRLGIKMRSVFKIVHTLLLNIIREPIGVPPSAVGEESRNVFGKDCLTQTRLLLEKEASDVIRVGFDFFYPTAASRKHVLTLCMSKDAPNLVLLNAIMDRLSQNFVVSRLIKTVLPRMLSGVGGDTAIPGSLDPPAVADLLVDLLARTASKLDSRIDHLESSNFDMRGKNTVSSPYTRLLLAVQNHLLAGWRHALQKENGGSSTIPLVTHSYILSYGEQLFVTACRSVMLCSKSVKGCNTTEKLESFRQLLSESFLALILMPFIGALSITPAHPSVATKLLPSLLKLIQEVNGMNEKVFPECFVSGDFERTRSKLRSEKSIPGAVRLHAMLVHLAGRLVAVVTKSTLLTPPENALKRWLSSKLLSGGVRLDSEDKMDLSCSTAAQGDNHTSSQDHLGDLSQVLQWSAIGVYVLPNAKMAGVAEGGDNGRNGQQDTFLKNLILGEGEPDLLNGWIQSHIFERATPQSPQAKIPKATNDPPEIAAGQRSLRALVAVLLKFNGYVTEAMSQSKILSLSRGRIGTNQTLSEKLVSIWKTALFLQKRVALEPALGDTSDEIQQRAKTLALSPATNVLPMSSNIARSVIRHCSFLLEVNPAYSIQLLKRDDAERENANLKFNSLHIDMSKTVCDISIDEVFDFVSKPLDISVLSQEMLRRKRRAQIRATGLDLSRYLLQIISPQFGYVRAQAIAQIPFALTRFPRETYHHSSHGSTDLKNRKSISEPTVIGMEKVSPYACHYMVDLQGCGASSASLVHAAFANLYEELAALLVDDTSTQSLKLAILHSWAIKLQSPDHLRHSKFAVLEVASPTNKSPGAQGNALDAFGGAMLLALSEDDDYANIVQGKSLGALCSRILNILGGLLSSSGDILSTLSDDDERGGDISCGALHHTAWRIFFLLGVQLCNSDENLLGNDNSLGGKATNPHPLYSVLVKELDRVQDCLIDASNTELNFLKVSRRAGLRVLISGKMWMTHDQPGAIVPDSARRTSRDKLALSFWIQIPKHNYDDAEIPDGSIKKRRVICIRAHGIPSKNNPDEKEYIFYPAVFLNYENAKGTKSACIEFVISTCVGGTYADNKLISSTQLEQGKWAHVICTYGSNGGNDMSIYIDGGLCGRKKTSGEFVWSSARPLHVGAPKSSVFPDACDAVRSLCAETSFCGWISDLCHFDEGVEDDDIPSLSKLPSPNAMKLKIDADNYSYRLVSFALEIVRSDAGRVGLVDNTECIAVMLSLLRYTSGKVQRCILQFLGEIIPRVSPLSVHTPTMSSMAGSGLAAAKANRSMGALWKYLTHILGVAWFCTEEDHKSGLSGSVNSVLAQFLSPASGDPSASMPSFGLPFHDGSVQSAHCESHRNAMMADRYALITGIVRLLKSLLISPLWVRAISDSLKESISELSAIVASTLYPKGSPEESMEKLDWKVHRAHFVHGLSAIYVLGGLVQQPHVGAEVYFPTLQNTTIDFLGATVSGLTQTSGTLVKIDWEKRTAKIVPLNTGEWTTITVPLNLLKIVYRDDNFEIDIDVLKPFLAIVKMFLGVSTSDSSGKFDISSGPSGANASLPWMFDPKCPLPCAGIVTQSNSILCFLRSRCLRALSSISSNASVAKVILDSDMLPPLLRAAVSDIASAASTVSASGNYNASRVTTDHNDLFDRFKESKGNCSGSRIYTNAMILSEKLSIWVSVPALEHLGEDSWSRLHSASTPLSLKELRRQPRLESLGGAVSIDRTKTRVESVSNFPSVRLGAFCLFPLHNMGNLTATNIIDAYPAGAVVGGRWYYETILLSDGLMQIGWADALYKGDAERGQGVGDHPHSWAIDGYRCKKWNSSSADYGERWHVADVVGCMIDLESLQIRYTLNGQDLGVAFTGFHSVGGVYPAASFNMQQTARFNFGPPHSEFAFPPPAGFKGITDAIRLSANSLESSSQKEAVSSSSMRESTSELANAAKADVSQPHEINMQRQVLVDNLVSMGFPVDWCVRAANVQRASVMDESRAIAWIIEKMEFESLARIDGDTQDGDGEGNEASQFSSFLENGGNINFLEQGGNDSDDINYSFMEVHAERDMIRRIRGEQNSSEEDDDEDDDDEEDDEDEEVEGHEVDREEEEAGEEAQSMISSNIVARDRIAAEERFASGSGALAHRHRGTDMLLDESLINDEECNEIYAPVAERFFASPLVGRQGLLTGNAITSLVASANNAMKHLIPGMETATLLGASAAASSVLSRTNHNSLGSDAYPSSDILGEIVSGLHPIHESMNRLRNKATMQSLSNTNDDQELWGLGLATSCALSTVYARSAILSLLLHGKEVKDDQARKDEHKLPGILGTVVSSPQCVLMFVDFLKLVRFRGPLPHNSFVSFDTENVERAFLDELDDILSPMFSLLLQNSPSILDSGKVREIESRASVITNKSLKGNSPLFLTVVVDEALSHFTRACAREYDRMLWISRPAPPIHPYASSVLTLTCDSDALVQPSPIWAAWALNTLINEVDKRMSGHETHGALNDNVVAAIENEVFTVGVLATLLRAAYTPNMALKDILFRLSGRILYHCVSSCPTPTPDEDCSKWLLTAKAFMSAVREACLARVFTGRFRKERDQSVLCSSYLQSLTSLLVVCAEVRSLIKNKSSRMPVVNAETNNGTSEDKPGRGVVSAVDANKMIPELIVDDVGVNNVSLAWSMSTEEIAKTIESKQNINVRVACAEMAQPFIEGKYLESSLEFNRLTSQRVVAVMDYGGYGTRPKTLSTLVCNDLLADSRYAFRLEIDIVKSDYEQEDEAMLDDENPVLDENEQQVVRTVVGPPLYVDTKNEMLFMLDPASCGSNLVLSNNNMIVTNTVNKKWNAIRASASFSSGFHYWEVHIDKCVSKNIFVGVMTENGNTDNYVGSDREGWGYLANKAIWHNKGKMCTYGELFREGDRIGISLDMDCGTICFSRNGKDLGVAVEGLSGELYPAFSLYNLDDQISLIPASANASHSSSAGVQNSVAGNAARGSDKKKNASHSGSMSRRMIEDLYETTRCLSSLMRGEIVSDSPLHEAAIIFFAKWRKNEIRRYRSSEGYSILVDISLEACRAFGFTCGEVVPTPKGEVVIVGTSDGVLWWKGDADVTVQSWSRKVCREIRLALGPKPSNSPVNATLPSPQHSGSADDLPRVLTLDSGIDVQSVVEKCISICDNPWEIKFSDVDEANRPLIAFLYVINHRLEDLLPLVEVWRDGYALSAAGLSPRVGLDGLITSAPPLSWTCGHCLLEARGLIFSWSKHTLFRSLIDYTGREGPTTKIRLAVSRGTLDLESMFRQLRLVASSELRCGVQFVIGRPGEDTHLDQEHCFRLICEAINGSSSRTANNHLIGELIGTALRTNNRFKLILPSSVWACICNPSAGSAEGADFRSGVLEIIPGYILPLFSGEELKGLCWSGLPS